MSELARLVDLTKAHARHFDALALGVIDFKAQKCTLLGDTEIFFDLASVTKVLAGASVYALHADKFGAEERCLLEHRAGLPAWGLLPNPGWREQILAYPVRESETLYSDFSCIRFNLEIENKFGKSAPELLKDIWHQDLRFWRDLPIDAACPVTGSRGKGSIRGEVHDPNAWVIGEWCGHAGLFGTLGGVCQTLLQLNQTSDLLALVSRGQLGHGHRFIFGWDRVSDPQTTLAGKGCSAATFGHLGFTGTSVWIDPQRGVGHVILSNATRDGWYMKDDINDFRRRAGELVWRSYP